MKLGFPLRRANSFIQESIRNFFRFAHFFIWFLLDPSKFKLINTKKIKNILVIQEGAIGDTYILVGCLNNIKRKYPRVNLFVLTPEEKRKFIKAPYIKVLDIKKAKRMIKNRKFDAAVIISIPYSSNLFYDLIKIPYVTCADYINIGGFFKKRPFFFTRYIFPKTTGHEYYAEGFKPLGIKVDKPEFYFTKEGEKEAAKFIKKHKITKNEKMIFCHVAVGNRMKAIKEGKIPTRELLPERWAEVATELIKRYNARVIFTGTDEDSPIIMESIKKIKDQSKVINAAGKLSIEATASLLKKGDLLISVDTSMIHFGAQAGIPLVGLYGQFPLKHSHPWTDNKIILYHYEVCHACRNYYCFEGNPVCINAITSKEIISAADKFLSKKKEV
jgi:ADP-heptose:LPS heptosyltransferase